MIKYCIPLISLLFLTNEAYAEPPQLCGPTVETYGQVNEDVMGRQSNHIGFRFSWKIGSKEICDRYNSNLDDHQVRETQRRDAINGQEEIRVLKDKLLICGDFTIDTAPPSIKSFCGDLLGIEVRKEVVSQPNDREIPEFSF